MCTYVLTEYKVLAIGMIVKSGVENPGGYLTAHWNLEAERVIVWEKEGGGAGGVGHLAC